MRDINEINFLHHLRSIDLRRGNERTICGNKKKAKYFYRQSYNLMDFTGEKYSQVGVITRDYHVVNKENIYIWMITDCLSPDLYNTVRYVCGRDGLLNLNLINFMEEKRWPNRSNKEG